jgi:myo-inositol 2-dehydrogenase / D-chiro-inositol 1-dehydrogenase
MKEVGFAVIGAGRIGEVHGRNVRGVLEGTSLVVVADPDIERARAVAGQARATTDIEAAIGDPEVDAVIIASPTPVHAAQIITAARAQKPIFCEKPVAQELDETIRAMDIVASEGVPFQIGFNRRYDPAFARIRRLLDEGALGRPEMFRALSCDPEPAPLSYLKDSGGIYRDQAIHDIDIARFFCGDVAEVTASGACNVVPELQSLGDVDTSVLVLRFVSGALGVIQNSRRTVYGHDVRVEVMGERGKAVGEVERATPVWLYQQEGIQGDYACWFIDRFAEAYRREVEAFVQSLRAGATPSPGPKDAIEALRVALAATLSLQEKRTVSLSSLTS